MVLHGIVLLASARAVSRKTPTYFIILLAKKPLLDLFGLQPNLVGSPGGCRITRNFEKVSVSFNLSNTIRAQKIGGVDAESP